MRFGFKKIMIWMRKFDIMNFENKKEGCLMNTKVYEKLKSLKPILKERYGIEEFALFGSQARDDYTSNSDIDIAILKIKKKDYFLRAKAKYFLEDVLQKKIDIGYFDSMRNILKKYIEKEMIYV